MPARLGAVSTGEQVLWLLDQDLEGKTAVVTGANGALGKQTALVLAKGGAHVVLTARSQAAGEAAAAEIVEARTHGSVAVQQLDLADLGSVRAAAAEFAKLGRIDFLVLNAGVMGTPKQYTKAGFEQQIGVNHFGHFVLVRELLAKLKAQDNPSRIVVVSSKAQLIVRGGLAFDDLHYRRRRYWAMGAYAQSKLANTLFAAELARRLQGTKVKAYSLHPGSISTELVRHWAPPGSWLRFFVRAVVAVLPFGEFKTVDTGVSTTIFACVAPVLEDHSGAYLEDCAIKQPPWAARQPEQAARLWEVTERQLAAAEAPPQNGSALNGVNGINGVER